MYLTPNQVYKQYGFHPKTLSLWAEDGKITCIRSPGGHRRNLAESLDAIKSKKAETILYARVSTSSQKDDLYSQIDYLGLNYPGSRCVSDIGSGLNFKRKK